MQTRNPERANRRTTPEAISPPPLIRMIRSFNRFSVKIIRLSRTGRPGKHKNLFLAQIQKLGEITFADDVTAPESDPFEFPGEDLGVVMGQFQPYRLFHLDFF